MTRQLSPAAVAAMFGQYTDEALLMTLRIKHSSIPSGGILRFVRNGEDLVVTDAQPSEDPDRIGTYLATWFEASLPDDVEDRAARVTLEIQNVDQVIVDTVRRLDPTLPPPLLTLEAVLASSPNTIEVSVNDVTLRKSEWDAAQVRGELNADDDLNEPFPAKGFTPTTAPGLFRVIVG